MHFEHSEQVHADFPSLAAGVLLMEGVHAAVNVTALVEDHLAAARARLGAGTEADLPQIQAWRRAFTAMGLKPTQYRCAAEALLRRLRKEGTLPRLHPLVDLCNAVSAATAVPVAAFDLDRVYGDLQVRRATGTECYVTFAGGQERPEPGEVVFADTADQAHARRWTNRQSGASAVRENTRTVLVIAEALHETAISDVEELITTLTHQIGASWATTPATALLTRSDPRFVITTRRTA